MTTQEIRKLDNDTLFKLSLQRGEPHNRYTPDALKAQAEWNNRKGNIILSGNSKNLCKIDRSYYSERYY